MDGWMERRVSTMHNIPMLPFSSPYTCVIFSSSPAPKDTGYSLLDSYSKRLQLYSEQSFYYSFYEELVRSANFMDGVRELFNETRSEYPSHINAIERFNIYPEVG